MTPIDPMTLTRFVEALTQRYGAVPVDSESAAARAWTNPWHKANGTDGNSKIFITKSNHVRYGDHITKASWMSERSIQAIISGHHPVVKNSDGVASDNLTALDGACLVTKAPTQTHDGVTTMARAAKKKEAKAKTPRKAAVKQATTTRRAAAPKQERAPRADTGGDKVKIDRTRYAYETSDVKSASGRKTVSNGDPLAMALAGKTADEVVSLVREFVPEKIKDTWANLNEGMRRMSAGNVLRTYWKGKGSITIDGKRIRVPE